VQLNARMRDTLFIFQCRRLSVQRNGSRALQSVYNSMRLYMVHTIESLGASAGGHGGRSSALNACEVGGAVALFLEHAFFELQLLELLLGGRHGLAELEHKVHEAVGGGRAEIYICVI
jgi:hypothetical protein